MATSADFNQISYFAHTNWDAGIPTPGDQETQPTFKDVTALVKTYLHQAPLTCGSLQDRTVKELVEKCNDYATSLFTMTLSIDQEVDQIDKNLTSEEAAELVYDLPTELPSENGPEVEAKMINFLLDDEDDLTPLTVPKCVREVLYRNSGFFKAMFKMAERKASTIDLKGTAEKPFPTNKSTFIALLKMLASPSKDSIVSMISHMQLSDLSSLSQATDIFDMQNLKEGLDAATVEFFVSSKSFIFATNPANLTPPVDDPSTLEIKKSLRHADLIAMKGVSDDHVETFIQDCPNITTLALYAEKLTEKSFVAIASLKNLESLTLQGTGPIPEAFLKYLDQFTGLNSLHFHSYTEETNLEILRTLGKLKTLGFIDCALITDETVEQLSAFKLKELGLTRCEKLTDGCIKHINQMTALETLDLSSSQGITGLGLSNLQPPALQKLIIEFCDGIEPEDIAALKGRMTNLLVLDDSYI